MATAVAGTMSPTFEPAFAHLRKMESRIERQTALIVKLKAEGCDTEEPARVLAVLQMALEEMRLQLGQLMPTAERPQSRTSGQSHLRHTK